MELEYNSDKPAVIKDWNKSVREGMFIPIGHVILTFEEVDSSNETKTPTKLQRFKSSKSGIVQKLLVSKGDPVSRGTPILRLGPCHHPTVMRDMCAECGMDLRKLDEPNQQTASVSMVHSVPELRVSMEQAQKLGKVDEDRLLDKRKLVLLVDLDQTLIHTTNDNVPNNLKDVFHFQLWGHGSVWYHTRIRPYTHQFLDNVSKLYELHICTFGTRHYAYTIAQQLDPTRKLFSDRILSRDECFSQNSKTANLKELFPRGDHMVCIIDDREDVWNYAPNLIHVKPYHFFRHTGDINAPPGLSKKDQDDKTGFQFEGDKVKGAKPDAVEKCKDMIDGNSKQDENTTSTSSDSDSVLGLTKASPQEIAADLNLSEEDDSESNDSGKEEVAAEGDMEESNDEDSKKEDTKVSQPIIAPEIKSIKPETESIKPSSESIEPETESIKPEAETIKPEAETIKPEAETIKPEAETIKPKAETIKPEAETNKPEAEIIKPEAETNKPEAETNKPEAEIIKPEGDTIKPEAESIKPEAESIKPEAESIKPGSDSIELESESIKPAPASIKPVNYEPTTESMKPPNESKEPATESMELPTESIKSEAESTKSVTESLKPPTESITSATESIKEELAKIGDSVISAPESSECEKKDEMEVDNSSQKCEKKDEMEVDKSSEQIPAKDSTALTINSISEDCADSTSSKAVLKEEEDKEKVLPEAIPPKMMEVEDEDDYLLYLEQILKSIHDAFYSIHDDMVKRKEGDVPDVKTVIPYVRTKVLKNINVVFSGVVPTHIPLKSSKAYQIALNLGAHVSEKVMPPNKPGTSSNIESPTTHVVAARMGTAKVNEARRYKGIHIVTPEWLWTCAERWEHVDEKLFRLDKAKSVKRNPPAHCASPDFKREKIECITPIDGPGDQKPSSSKPAMRKQRTPSGRFMDTINPLLSFSAHEIDTMAHEVDDICNESESSSSDDEEEIQKEKDRAARRRSSRSVSGQDHENVFEDPSASELTKESMSSTSSSSESYTGDEVVFGCSAEAVYHKKRKRHPRTETETEDEPLSVKFRRGEPLPSDIDSLNLMNQSSDEDDGEAMNEEDEWMAQALEREFLDDPDNSQSQNSCDMR